MGDLVAWVTAASTVVLAAITFWYAWTTKEIRLSSANAADAARRAAEAAEAQMRYSATPQLLEDSAVEVHTVNARSVVGGQAAAVDAPHFVKVRFRNAGPGPAVNVWCEIVVEGRSYPLLDVVQGGSVAPGAPVALIGSLAEAEWSDLFRHPVTAGAARIYYVDGIGLSHLATWSLIVRAPSDITLGPREVTDLDQVTWGAAVSAIRERVGM